MAAPAGWRPDADSIHNGSLMPAYRILLLEETRVEDFRTRAPRPGALILKPQHYEEAGSIEAEHPYDAWKRLQAEEPESAAIRRPLGVGDVLVDSDDRPMLLNYWGFDSAAWLEHDAPHEALEAVAEQSV